MSDEIKEQLRAMPCNVCMRAADHLHHVKTRGAGGKDERNLLPVCAVCHDWIHTQGIKTAERKIGRSLRIAAENCWNLAALWAHR